MGKEEIALRQYQRNILFKDVKVEDYGKALEYLQAEVKKLVKNEYLVHIGEPFRYAGIVEEGVIEGSFHNETDDKIVVNHFEKGDLFGEALACAEVMNSPIQLRAITDSVVLCLNLKVIYEGNLDAEYKQKVAVNLIRSLVKHNVYQNKKMRLLGQKKLRDRFLMYLQNLPRTEKGEIVLPFTITTIAEYLGVNRSSLSREIGQMMDERILRIDGKVLRFVKEKEP